MKKYTIKYTESYEGFYEIEAETEEKAKEFLQCSIYEGKESGPENCYEEKMEVVDVEELPEKELRREGNLLLGTTRQIAEFLYGELFMDGDDIKGFHDIDFADVSDIADINSKPLFETRREASGWCGLKEFDAGFDDGSLKVVSGWYGDCVNTEITKIYDDLEESSDFNIKNIESAMIDILDIPFDLKNEVQIIAEILN